MERRYARPLGLHYSYDPRDLVLVFDDGVKYTLKEAVILAKGGAKENDLRAIHKVKAVFFGEVLDPDDTGPARTTRVPVPHGKVHKPETPSHVRKIPGQQGKELPDSCQMRLDL